jgi:hypothetical protein
VVLAQGVEPFNVTHRLAEAFDFAVDDTEAISAGARYLLSRGYR